MRIVNMKIGIKIFLLLILIGTVILTITFLAILLGDKTQVFDGERALTNVKYQLDLGPRTMGSKAHDKVVSWMIDELKAQGWQVETQEAVISGQVIKNIIAKRGDGTPWIILGSHYDSRIFADQDKNPVNRKLPVPGANDGASSTAILMELARVLSVKDNKQIWLVFFDDEDNGTAAGTGWSIGSSFFVSQLKEKPDSVVILDMVGDKDLKIYKEGKSDRELNTEIWNIANGLGYKQFVPSYKYDLIDDHIPFIQAGIKAVDVIDFDYPYWHTTNDTLDKVSAESLKIVGDTILKWLEQYSQPPTPVK
jgi:glutaminyl-peptide cyclotransferase